MVIGLLFLVVHIAKITDGKQPLLLYHTTLNEMNDGLPK